MKREKDRFVLLLLSKYLTLPKRTTKERKAAPRFKRERTRPSLMQLHILQHAPRSNTCPSPRSRQASSLLQRRFSETADEIKDGRDTRGGRNENTAREVIHDNRERNTRRSSMRPKNEDTLAVTSYGQDASLKKYTFGGEIDNTQHQTWDSDSSPTAMCINYNLLRTPPPPQTASIVTCIITGNLSRSIAMLAPREGLPPLSLLAVITIFAPGASSTLDSSLSTGQRWRWCSRPSLPTLRTNAFYTYIIDVGDAKSNEPRRADMGALWIGAAKPLIFLIFRTRKGEKRHLHPGNYLTQLLLCSVEREEREREKLWRENTTTVQSKHKTYTLVSQRLCSNIWN